MRKNVLNRLISYLLISVFLIGTLSVSGCGKNESEYTYISEYHTLNMDCKTAGRIVTVGDFAYVIAMDRDDDFVVTKSKLYKVDMTSFEATEVADFTGKIQSIETMTLASCDRILIKYSNMEMQTHLAFFDIKQNKITDDIDIAAKGIGGEMNSMYSVAVDAEGNIYYLSDDAFIHVLKPDFSKYCDIDCQEDMSAVIATRDGEVCVVVTSAMGAMVKSINLEFADMTTKYASTDGMWISQTSTGEGHNILVQNYDDLSEINLDTGSYTKLFNYVEMDVKKSDIVHVAQSREDEYLLLVNDTTNPKAEEAAVVVVKRIPMSEAKDIKELTYGTITLYGDTETQIIKFNRSHSDIRIKVHQYFDTSASSTMSYYDAINKFNTDLVSGNSPDIIDLSNLPFDSYASKGLFEDLHPYLEESGYKDEDFVRPVFESYKIGDGIYAILPSFQIKTIGIKASRFPGRTTWTMEEFQNIFKDTDPHCLMDMMSRDWYFTMTLYSDLDAFIDWDTGRCDFNNESFYNILEYTNQIDADEFYMDFDGSVSGKINSGKINIVDCYFANVDSLQRTNVEFGNDVTYIGYPTDDGSSGTRFYPSGTTVPMCISSESKHKEEAWEFIESMINKEMQDKFADGNSFSGFPILKSSLQKMYDVAQTPVYGPDENGETVEKPHGTYYDEMEIDFYCATDEEINTLNELIMHSTPEPYIDKQIIEIITEECAAYYDGVKSAQEVADIIENRLGIYVSENS